MLVGCSLNLRFLPIGAVLSTGAPLGGAHSMSLNNCQRLLIAPEVWSCCCCCWLLIAGCAVLCALLHCCHVALKLINIPLVEVTCQVPPIGQILNHQLGSSSSRSRSSATAARLLRCPVAAAAAAAAGCKPPGASWLLLSPAAAVPLLRP